MYRSRRNVFLLASSQALMLSAIVMSMALGAVLGNTLAENKSLATLPIALMVIGTAIASVPASLLMQRFGRRAGFLIGAALGVAGSLTAALALREMSFAWFAFGHFLLGAYQGFANYYRFAAVEATEPAYSSRAISLVVAGGIVAAFIGPQLAQWGREWVAGELFVGSYLAQAALSLIALFILSCLSLPPVTVVREGRARPISDILAQPALQTAILGAATGYAVMIMVMTATPLSMLGCGFGRTEVTPVIQWHVVGMFAPSFFTGSLVKRFGALRIMQVGFLFLLAQVTLTVLGVAFVNFLAALIFLGIGWNFAFIGGTALLTQTYRPVEQLKVQAVNEFAIFGLVAFSTVSAGWLYDQFGWATLNLSVLPLLLLALVAAARLERRQRRAPVIA